jgi:hypothetical protein
VAAVKKAVAALPCVEPDSVTIDFPNKQAHFTAKKDCKVSREDVNKALAAEGKYSVTEFQAPATH